MAQKRMFSLQVVDTDKFMDMPTSAQALYFHLGMHGDDDGFVASPRKIARAAGCNDDDMRLLAAKEFIIPMDSGVVVITDWKLNNTIKGDRYSPTIYQEEKALLQVGTAGRYSLGTSMEPKRIQNGSNMEPQIRLDLTEDSGDIGGCNSVGKPPKSARFSPPSVDDVRAFCDEQGYTTIDPERFVSYYQSANWMVGKVPMADWRASVQAWHRKDVGKKGSSGGRESGVDRLARLYKEEFGE